MWAARKKVGGDDIDQEVSHKTKGEKINYVFQHKHLFLGRGKHGFGWFPFFQVFYVSHIFFITFSTFVQFWLIDAFLTYISL